MGVLNADEFTDLFRGFTCSARRLESRQHTHIDAEQPRFRAFLAGELPETCEWEPTSWTEMIGRQTRAGRTLQRVRVMSQPLSEYNRYLLYRTPYNLGAGEDIRYLERAQANAMGLPDHDYWVFDSALICFLRFTANGRLIGYDVVDDPEIVAWHEEFILRALDVATPYDAYVAADPTRIRPPIRLGTTNVG
jgi:hypothetical protein